MPELPEVETMRRGIMAIAGATITDVQRAPCRRKPIRIHPRIDVFRRRVVGAKLTAVMRVGKRITLELASDEIIVLEPRMTGLVLVADPPTRAHLRWRMTLADAPVSQLMYWDRRGLGSVTLFSRREFDARFGSDRVGPDALVANAATLQSRLADSRRAIKVALLDQRAIAGIGNLYASEILHTAGIHPGKVCCDFAPREWRALAAAISDVLKKAIRYEGSTLSDGTYRNALNRDGSYQNHHRVYDKEDCPCPRCQKKSIVRIVQAQRSTFFCPHCQRPPRKRTALYSVRSPNQSAGGRGRKRLTARSGR